MESLISVIVITYNQERYIHQALQSILSQNTDKVIEILVGNDASTDRTGEILEELARTQNLNLIQREQNLGASANLYDLLEHARGKYVALLEGDDYWTDPDKLQKQYDFLETHPDYIGCTHECLLVDELGNELSDQNLDWLCKKREYTIQDHQGLYLAGQTGTLMFRNIFKEKPDAYEIIRTAHPLISDRTLQMVLALEGPLYRLDDCMGAYRQINKIGERNATSRCFASNIHSAYDSFALTCQLEEYAKGRKETADIDFNVTKKDFFTSAVYQCLRKRSPLIYQDIKKILHYPGVNRWSYIFFLPRGIIRTLKKRI